ncbi:MAG TPA: hypothetical protein VGD76_08480 [Ramlibacter sp.]
MKTWLGLLAAPSVALATQSVLYSMVTPSCSSQTRLQLHLVAAVGLAIVLVMAVLAFGESSLRRGEPSSHDSDEGSAGARRRFLASAASAVAGLSALVIIAMWFTLWVLTPCEP